MMDDASAPNRALLREIVGHWRAVARRQGAAVRACGSVEVFIHPRSAAPDANFVMPHPYAIAIAPDDLAHGLRLLGAAARRARVVVPGALVPPIDAPGATLGLTRTGARPILVYQPLEGPHLPGETPYGRLPLSLPPRVSAWVVEAPRDLVIWLEVLHTGQAVDPLSAQGNAGDEIAPLLDTAAAGADRFVLAAYDDIPLGAARLSLNPPASAWLALVTTAPLWAGMGLEVALVACAVRTALDEGARVIFTCADGPDQARFYRRLGFVDHGPLWIYDGEPRAEQIGESSAEQGEAPL